MRGKHPAKKRKTKRPKVPKRTILATRKPTPDPRPRPTSFVPRTRVYIGFRIYDRELKKARAVRGCTIRAEGWNPYDLHRYIVLALTGGKRQLPEPEPPPKGQTDEHSTDRTPSDS